MPTIDLVVFDIAGTLIHDTGFVLAAFRAALQEFGGAITPEQLQAWRGASKREVLQSYLAQNTAADEATLLARLQRSEAAFRETLQASLAESGVRTIEGVEPTFAWLRERKIKIALNTGFDRVVTDAIMHATGWREQLIDASVCSDDVAQGRPAPFMIFRAMEATRVQDVRHVIAVGDTVNDLLSGWNAGVRGVIGVLTGSHSKDQLSQAPHTHIIPSVAELPELIVTAFV
ncbi:phosphonatase-like hydrolase [candidate division KSB1 bacterium]|nr:phosphonatase-like hydrolase [candidate division KSB1 bacterium]